MKHTTTTAKKLQAMPAVTGTLLRIVFAGKQLDMVLNADALRTKGDA